MITKDTEVIISLTSHKTRIKHCAKAIYSAIRNCPNAHVVLTISKENEKYIEGDIKTLIDANVVELLLVDEDLGPHTKYYYTMMKYRDYPIITIDDDQHYFANTIPNLLATHKKYPNAVIGRQCRTIRYDENKNVLPFSYWAGKFGYCKTYGVSKTHHLMGVGAILYPANILNINEDLLPEIRKYRKADDIYLNALELRYNVDVYCMPDFNCDKPTAWDERDNKNADMTPLALREEKTRWTDSDYYVRELAKDFNGG